MKTLRNIAVLVLITAGFAYAQDITVQGEKKLNVNFKKYKTFGWMEPDQAGRRIIAYSYEAFPDPSMPTAKHDDVVVYSYYYTLPSPDSMVNNTVTAAVQGELEGRGYRKDNAHPDLLVAYKIFDQSSKIKGYDKPPTTVNSTTEVHQPEDTVSYKLNPGTVLVSLLDARSGDVVWEGFASGVSRSTDPIHDKDRIKQAVNLIFKKYEFRSDGYTGSN